MSNSVGTTDIPRQNQRTRMKEKRKQNKASVLFRAKPRQIQLNILQWNAGGLSNVKMTELKNVIAQKKISIVMINEANITAENFIKYRINDFTLYPLYKSRQVASGMLIGVKNSLRSDFTVVKQMSTYDTSEMAKLQIWFENAKFTLYCVYSSPKNNHLQLDILEIPSTCIIMGDFNAASPKWGYNYYNTSGRTVEDLINSKNLELVYNPNDPGTYLHYSGSSTNPDLVMVTSNLYEKCKKTVSEDLGGDHRMTLLSVDLGPMESTSIPRMTWNFKKANWSEYQKLTETEMKEVNSKENPHKMLKHFCGILVKSAKLTIPRGKQYNYRPYWTRELSERKSIRDQARKKAEKTQDPNDVITWRKESALLKKLITTSKRESWNRFLQNLNYKTDSHKAYRLLNALNNKYPAKTSQPFIINNREVTDKAQIARLFNRHFSTSHELPMEYKKREKSLLTPGRLLAENTQNNLEAELSKEFSIEELKEAIRKTQLKRQPGPDNIFAEFVHNLGPRALQSLLSIYNIFWKSRTSLPAEWTKAVIVPILKPGKPPKLINSYRPISLTSVLVKIQERMICARLNWYLERGNLLVEEQSGFRQGRSTSYQIIRLTEEIKTAFNKRESILAVFIDFKGAYDTVWRAKLLNKLKLLNIKGNMSSWISRFLRQRWSKVRYADTDSAFQQSKVGLPQGAVSSTALFNIYINDLPSRIKAINGVGIGMFADDVVLWASAPNNSKQQRILEERMNGALAALCEWASENNMKINETKTQYQFFSLRHNNCDFSLSIRDQFLPKSGCTRYLGIYMDNKLSWKNHISNIIDKVNKRLRILKRLAGATWGGTHDTLNTTYKTYVKPILTYGSEVLITADRTSMGKMEKAQNNALRLITGAVKSTPTAALQLYTRNLPISKEIMKQGAIAVLKLKALPHATWTKNCQMQQLKTQSLPLECGLKCLKQFNIPSQIEDPCWIADPLEYQTYNVNLSLLSMANKQDTNPTELKMLALSTIEERYPSHEWLRIYTDGSLLGHNHGAGAGIYSTLFSHYVSVGEHKTSFDGEVEAISTALRLLLGRQTKLQKIVFLVDSMAAIQAIASNKLSLAQSVREARAAIRQIERLGKTIHFQWVPSHVGVMGNEKADVLAKKGSNLHHWNKSLNIDSAIRLINKKTREDFLKEARDLGNGKKWKCIEDEWQHNKSKPRKEAVANFRLGTGHDCLAAHLKRIHVLDSDLCVLCEQLEEPMDREHLLKCPRLGSEQQTLKNFARLYWDARRLMG